MKPKAIAALAVLVVFSFLLLRSFGGQVGGYMAFEEATRTQAEAHVVGTWVKESGFSYDRASNIFSFEMQDEKGGRRLVRYHNPKPANFEEAQQVVVQGRAEGDAFVASHILVKCPSKYNDERGLQGPAPTDAAPAART